MSGLWMISDSKNFWDKASVAPYSQIASIRLDGSEASNTPNFHQLKGQRVLFLVHGEHESKQAIVESYHRIEKEAHTRIKGLYDTIIGYVFPSEANSELERLGRRLQKHLEQIHALAQKVDVIAHGQGNRLVFEALKGTNEQPLLGHFFSMSPPDGQDCSALTRCEKVYLFHTEEPAAFSEGAKLPPNLQLIDCTELGISYPMAPRTFDFLRDCLNNHVPGPHKAAHLKLLMGPRVVIVQEQKPLKTLVMRAALLATCLFGSVRLFHLLRVAVR